MATATLSPQAEAKRRWLVRNSGKDCSQCGQFKRMSEYGNNSRYLDGLQIVCNSCRKG